MLLDYFFTENTTPVAVTQGGHFVKDHKKKIKAHQAALDAREQEKLNQAKLLRRQIEEARNPKQPEIEIVSDEEPRDLAPNEVPITYDPTPQLRAALFELERELLVLAEQRRKLQDEADMEAILWLLNNEIKKYTIN